MTKQTRHVRVSKKGKKFVAGNRIDTYHDEYDEFQMGLNVEKEHYDTSNHDINIIGKIVQDHLKENPRYYSEGVKKGFFSKQEVGLEDKYNYFKSGDFERDIEEFNRIKERVKNKFNVSEEKAKELIEKSTEYNIHDEADLMDVVENLHLQEKNKEAD